MELKSNARTSTFPVLFLTAKNDVNDVWKGLSLGAVDYISKPLLPALLSKRVETQLLLKRYEENFPPVVEEKEREDVNLQDALFTVVATIVEYRNGTVSNSMQRIRRYLKVFVEEMQRYGLFKSIMDDWNVEFLFQSAVLHDVGKIAIRDSILMKPGKLSEDEYEVMKEHTTRGVRIIEHIEENTVERAFLKHAKRFAGTHHEHWDGRGYPKGLEGDEIPLEGRLMAIVDAYDALVSERPYKKAFPHKTATEIIESESGSHFDPLLADLFLSRSEVFATIIEEYRALPPKIAIGG